MSQQQPVVIWLSRHEPRESQLRALNEIYPGVKVVQDPNPFGDAKDIAGRFRRSGAVDMVIVAPLAVIAELIKLGIRPLWAEMEIVPCNDPRAEVFADGNRYRYTGEERCYRFVRFRRIKEVRLEFDEARPLEWGRPTNKT
jgi:hypothetical protein